MRLLRPYVLCLLLSGPVLACGPEPDGSPPASDGGVADASGADHGGPTVPPLCPVVTEQALGQDSADFEVADDVLSFLLVAAGRSGPITTRLLISPDGSAVVPDAWYETSKYPVCTKCGVRIGVDPVVHSVLFPNSPASSALLRPGTWHYEAWSFEASGPIELRLFTKRGRAVPETGTVNLALHYAGDVGLSPGNAAVAAAVSELEEIYGTVGISVGGVDEYAVQGAPAAPLVESLDQLFAYRQGPPSAVPVFFVTELSDASGVVLAGLSPLPGPPGVPAGVVLTAGADDLGRSLAHEVGHYLGLWHIYEGFAKDILDPLPDTPGSGTENLMAPGYAGYALTAGQGEVMRRHPLVSHDCSR